ncbi:MAG: ATP-binding cassette domain-containing protein, partial [Gammaproteobacteria bacterium]|nr:ATP-binding cassette domain-containing protein [Gammaproteobacteria bacterium]
QHITLFNDTIAHNIAYGQLEGVSEAQMIEAAKAAHAWEFIERLPQGLNTMVGENGVLLSGGQRQRLAIARALLKNSPILILDEATSALDTESERHIQAALEELMENRTTLVIAHRLSTIEKADQIVVLDQGRIIEQGTHDELLKKDATYAALHRLQFEQQSSQPVPDKLDPEPA